MQWKLKVDMNTGGGGVYSDGNKSAEIEFYSLAADLGIYVYVHVYVYV